MLFQQIYGHDKELRLSEEQMRQMRINRWGADVQGPGNLFEEDYSDKFNTELTPDEEARYQAWAKEKHRENDVYDYDLRGAWKELQSGAMSEDERGHLGDKYKKPNHPTFSAESVYNGQDGIDGGVWSQNAEGKTVYTPGRKLSSVEADRLQRYFARNEPDAFLALKDHRLEEKPLPGITQPLGFFDGMGNAWKGVPSSVLQAASSGITIFKNSLADVLANAGNDETRRWWKSQQVIMDINARDIREYNKAHFEPDPETMGTASQIVHGIFKMLPKAIAYSSGLGAAGGAIAMGADLGIDETNRLMDEGVDRDTAVNAGMQSFAWNAIGMRLPPVLGASRLASVLYGAGVNVGTNIAETEGIKLVLEHENYDELAKQYELNAVNLAVSAAMGGAFGGLFWRSAAQIRADKYNAEKQKLYEDYRTKLFNNGNGPFTFQQAGAQAEINARAVVSFAETHGINPDKVGELAPKIVWTKDGQATFSGGEFHMPVTQGREWHMGPTKAAPDEQVTVVQYKGQAADRQAAMTQVRPLAAKGLRNEETGFVLTASDADLKKSLGGKFSYDERLFRAVAPVLDEVVAKARLMESSADVKHKNPEVQGVHIFATPVEIDGKLYRVQMVVRDYVTPKQERLATHKIAGIQIYEIENPPVSKADGGPSDIRGVTAPDIRLSSSPVAPSDHVISLAQLAGGRKPYVRQDGKGLFDSVDDSARANGGAYYEAREFQQIGGSGSGQPSDPLVAVHHISAENLLKVNELGGLAVPSIGITKANSGYSGFGDITLIGTKGLIDPATGTPVYSADAYTNTFPAFEWGKSVDKAKAEALRKEYRRAETTFRGGMDNTMRSLIDSPDRGDFMERFRSSVVSQKMFLDEKGIKVEPVYQKPYEGTPLEQALRPLWDTVSSSQSMDEMVQAYNATYVQAVDALGDKATRIQKRNADKVRNGGRLPDAYLYTLINNVDRIGKGPATPMLDSYATEKRIREVFENNSDGFDAWVEKKTGGLFGEPKIKVGGKLVPVTLQNVVKAMTKRVAKNTENTMTFGAGKVRAAASKKFKSVEDIQANREKVVDPAAADAANKSIDAAMGDFRNAAADFYGYKDTFAAMDDAMRALADSAKGKPTTERVRAALIKNGFKEPKEGFPAELLDSGVKILTDVQKGLTDYFEAKPQRAVGLNEFAGAVVPEGTSPAVLKVLTDAGIEVRTYAKDTVLPGGERTNNRLQAEKELSQKLHQDRGDVLFQVAYHGSPHVFSKFTLDHIGSGEGAQAHGWGLYFALDREVARAYKDALAGANYFISDRNANDIRAEIERKANIRKPDGQMWLERLEAFDEWYARQNPDAVREAYDDGTITEDAYDWFEREIRPAIKSQGRLYSVDIPEDDVMLREEVTFEKQPRAVQLGLSKLLGRKYPETSLSELPGRGREELLNDLTGLEVYDKDSSDRVLDWLTSGSTEDLSIFGTSDRHAMTREEAETKLNEILQEEGNGQRTVSSAVARIANNAVDEAAGNRIREKYYGADDNGVNSFAGRTGQDIYDALKVRTGSDKEASLLLNKYGIKGIRYNGARDGECAVVWDEPSINMLEFLQRKFDGGNVDGVRGSFTPSENTIKLTPNANLSTFSHEHSHWYLTNLLAHAGDENLSAEAKGDIAAILHAFSLKSIDEWNALSFEQKARFQERYAAWTEEYLAEGKIPDTCPKYLAGFFKRFGEWLMNMYRDLLGDQSGDNPAAQEIGERYKAQFGEELPGLSPEVRKVLDRMYGVEKKMANFKPKGEMKFAARVLQAQRANNDKVTAPLQEGGAPDAYTAAIRAQQAAATAMNTGEQVNVEQAMRGVPVNDQAVQQAQNSFARAFQMGDTGTIVVLQNRDRTGAVSVGQMNAIATAPDYTRLSVSRTTDSGAPIVSFGSLPDAQHQGRTEIVADSNGEKIPMTYAVVESDSVLRSNNFDGTPVAAYGTDSSQVHAVAGNGRMAGLAEAYNRGTAEQYRQDLIADAASVGIDSAAIQGMQHPVLVRFMPPEKVTTGFIERSNSSNVMEKSALETAVQDSPRIRNNVWKYQFDEDGNPTSETMAQFLADIGEPNALGKLITADGRPTETALNRIRAAAFYEAYRDRTLTALVADDTDKQGIKRILTAMAAFAPHVINIREASNGAVDLGPVLVDVVNRIRNAKIEGQPIESILGQGDMFGDNSAVQQVLGLFAENQNSAAGIARVLQPFAEALENRLRSSGNGPQAGLFGEAENVTTDMADAMGILRDAQNRVIEEGNAALREKGVTEGLRETLPAVDVNAVRDTLQAIAEAQKPAEKLAEAVVETVAPEAAPVREAAPEAPTDVPPDAALEAEARAAAAHQAHERELFADNPDRTQVESLAEVNPEQVYTWMDDDGQVQTMTAKELLESDAEIDAQADTDMAGMATAAMCIIRNQGITE